MSESMNFGHINISTEATISGNVKEIKTGLTLISKRLFTKIIIKKIQMINLILKKQIAIH